MTRTAPHSAFTLPVQPTRRPRALRRLACSDKHGPRFTVFEGFEREGDGVWSSKQRTAPFLAALRHIAEAAHDLGVSVRHSRFDDERKTQGPVAELRRALDVLRLAAVVALEPGELRLCEARTALAQFVEQRLARLAEHQDSLWTGEAWIDHLHICAALNSRRLDPR